MDELTSDAIEHAADAHFRALVYGMYSALEEQEFPAAQENCPKDTEELVRTAYLAPPIFTRDGAIITISFGNAETGDTGIYAVIQHEDMSLNHPNGGMAKYLEVAVMDGQSTINARTVAHAEAYA